MAPSYKLSYFDFPGKAEPIRLIFHYAGVPFEDNRVSREDFVKHVKPTLPFGQMPVLEVDGVVYNQSCSIARFVAKQFGLAGNNDIENLKIDSAVDNLEDLYKKAMELKYAKDEDKKAEIKGKLLNEVFPNYLKKFEDKVQQNGGYIALDRVTWADIYFLNLYVVVRNSTTENVFTNYPNILKLKDTLLQNSGIRTYLKNSQPSNMQTFNLQSEL